MIDDPNAPPAPAPATDTSAPATDAPIPTSVDTTATGGDPAAKALAPAAKPADTVNLLDEDLAKLYPTIAEVEDGVTKGLKYPVSREWLDEKSKDPQFAAFVAGLRTVATKGREATVVAGRALQAERAQLEADRKVVDAARQAAIVERGRLAALVNKVAAPPPVPKGGEPDPMSPDPKAQEYWARKHVSKVIEESFAPLREGAKAMAEEDAKAIEQAALEQRTAQAQAFIDKTPDVHVYYDRMRALVAEGHVKTFELAYQVAKSEALAAKAAEPAKRDTGPDVTKMTTREIQLHELENPGWFKTVEQKWQAAQSVR